MNNNNEIVAIELAEAGPVPPTLEDAAAYTPPAVSSLGGRSMPVSGRFNFPLLQAASADPGIAPNPSTSAGASPVLRELLMETGLPFTVVRELYDDGDPNGHLGGNAVDIVSDGLPAVAVLLAGVPELFSAVTWTDPDYPAGSLYVLGGVLTTVSDPGLVRLLDPTGVSMHVASSLERLTAALAQVSVQTALADAVSGPFASRDVYTVPTNVMPTDVDPGTVNRW